MLTKIKVPFPELMIALLSMDDFVLDEDQVDNLTKLCPSKNEIELLEGYKGDKHKLGMCEQLFLQLMTVPRVESKLRVFLFKMQFHTQIRTSEKFRGVMQTILSVGNALNQGTIRRAATGFRLSSLLKIANTQNRNKMTLVRYLCKVLAERQPELLDFPKDFVSLERSAKILLKSLARKVQDLNKGLEKVLDEMAASENDGIVSETFCKILNKFCAYAKAELNALMKLYSVAASNADVLATCFGESQERCPFEEGI